jgi:NAD(P)H-dependent FMN reductase
VGQNSFDQMPVGMIGASSGQIGTAVAQQSLRAVLSFCNARQMTAPEAYGEAGALAPEKERAGCSAGASARRLVPTGVAGSGQTAPWQVAL